MNMPSKGINGQSSQLHFHQMEGTLCQAHLMRQFEFGMHKQGARWATLSKGTQAQTQTAQSTQLHSHQMEGTLHQAQMRQFKFGMHRLVG